MDKDCVPQRTCSCIGHRMPKVFHMAPCCNEPHIDAVVVPESLLGPNVPDVESVILSRTKGRYEDDRAN